MPYPGWLTMKNTYNSILKRLKKKLKTINITSYKVNKNNSVSFIITVPITGFENSKKPLGTVNSQKAASKSYN